MEINTLNSPDRDKAATLSILLPLGVYLPSGATATVMSEKNAPGKPFPIELKTCIQKGCIGSTTLTPVQLNEMRSGAKLAITFAANPKDKPLVVHSSLTGITDGLAALKIE